MTRVDLTERGIYPILRDIYPKDVTATISRTSEQTAITGKTGVDMHDTDFKLKILQIRKDR